MCLVGSFIGTGAGPITAGCRRGRGEGGAFGRVRRARAEGSRIADLALAGATRVAALSSIAELSDRVEGRSPRCNCHLQLCYGHAVGASEGSGGGPRWADGVHLLGCNEEAEPKESG